MTLLFRSTDAGCPTELDKIRNIAIIAHVELRTESDPSDLVGLPGQNKRKFIPWRDILAQYVGDSYSKK
jgi:hypothetical protein